MRSLVDESPSFVVLTGGHPALTAKLTKKGLAVHEFPFSVGRPPEADEQSPGELVDLVIEDERPFWIARVQFTLIRDAEGIALVDSSSVHGTAVNGTLIGPGTDIDRVVLEPGANTIVLGGLDSPYVLELDVEQYEQKDMAA